MSKRNSLYSMRFSAEARNIFNGIDRASGAAQDVFDLFHDLLELEVYRERREVTEYDSRTGEPVDFGWVPWPEPWDGILWIGTRLNGVNVSVDDELFHTINAALANGPVVYNGMSMRYVPPKFERDGTVPAYYKFELVNSWT